MWFVKVHLGFSLALTAEHSTQLRIFCKKSHITLGWRRRWLYLINRCVKAFVLIKRCERKVQSSVLVLDIMTTSYGPKCKICWNNESTSILSPTKVRFLHLDIWPNWILTPPNGVVPIKAECVPTRSSLRSPSPWSASLCLRPSFLRSSLLRMCWDCVHQKASIQENK